VRVLPDSSPTPPPTATPLRLWMQRPPRSACARVRCCCAPSPPPPFCTHQEERRWGCCHGSHMHAHLPPFSAHAHVPRGTHANTYAPPVCVLRQPPHDQMPAAVRFTLSLPQKVHVYCTPRKRNCGRSRQRVRVASGQLPGATYRGVLGHLDLAHDLTQGGAIARAVLARDADLLGATGHLATGRLRVHGGRGGGLWERTAAVPRASDVSVGRE